MPTSHISNTQQRVGDTRNVDEALIGMWFHRAGRLVRAITAEHITFDEARDALVAAVNSSSEVGALRRAAWDAETVLGTEALISTLLHAAIADVSAPHAHLTWPHPGDVQAVNLVADTTRVHRDSAPVIAAEMLVRHGLSDELILAHLARQWPLDKTECQAALDAAHILVRREHPSDREAG